MENMYKRTETASGLSASTIVIILVVSLVGIILGILPLSHASSRLHGLRQLPTIHGREAGEGQGKGQEVEGALEHGLERLRANSPSAITVTFAHPSLASILHMRIFSLFRQGHVAPCDPTSISTHVRIFVGPCCFNHILYLLQVKNKEDGC